MDPSGLFPSVLFSSLTLFFRFCLRPGTPSVGSPDLLFGPPPPKGPCSLTQGCHTLAANLTCISRGNQHNKGQFACTTCKFASRSQVHQQVFLSFFAVCLCCLSISSSCTREVYFVSLLHLLPRYLNKGIVKPLEPLIFWFIAELDIK